MPTVPTTNETVISDIIEREGGSRVTNDPQDRGGRTQYGIDERSNPEAWMDGKVTEEEARAIYTAKYVHGPGFDKIVDDRLRAQLVDFGVNSGPAVAIQKIQKLVEVIEDGILGPHTLAAVNARRGDDLSNRLVAERIRLIGRIVSKHPAQIKFLNGWLDRALQFLE